MRFGSAKLRRPFLVLTAFLVSLPQSFAVEPPEVRMGAEHAEFFALYCVHCHGPDEVNGKVRLDTIPFRVSQDLQTADTWQKILNALNAGEMPPEGETQPTNDEKAAFLEELSEKMVVARKALSDPGGAGVMRRLNRREYANTIRSLLGVTIDVSELPNDAGAGSFDTVGTALYFSPAQFEMYYKLGRRALDEAIVTGPQPTTKKVRTQPEEWANREVAQFIVPFQDGLERYEAWLASDGARPVSDFGFLDEPRARRAKKQYDKNAPYYHAYLTLPRTASGVWFNQIHPSIDPGLSEAHPAGDYVLRICIGATDEAPSHRRFIEFGQLEDVGGGKTNFSLISAHQVTGTLDEPQVIEVPVSIGKDSGRNFRFQEMRPDHQMENFRKDPTVPEPALWVDWVEVEGPAVSQWPPESHRQIFFAGDDRPQDDRYAREILVRFAERAFRGKQPQEDYVDRLTGIYRAQKQSGAEFEEAVKGALAVILASPNFLYLTESGGEETAARELTDLELASRLSYFLWSAPPDEALLASARDGSLRQPEVMRRHVDRMIDNPKSWEFVTGFAHQWLDLDRIDLFQFDESLYPDFDESTKIAAVNEMYHFFDEVLREDLGVNHFLDSDFIVVNGLMAEYYGVEGVTGDDWMKIPAPPERGGLLAMAATLAMGSDGERTNPVERGAFVLRKLLNNPPPPAPANVPQLSRLDEEVLTTRERLGAHQEEAQCMHCHRKIDPLGFGLENFDAAGQWRDEETVLKVSFNKNGKRKSSEAGTEPIDASGKLHNGPSFDNYYELRSLLAARTDQFSRGLIEALLEYALGRSIGFSDEELITDLHADLRENDYRLRSLIHQITQSQAFRTK